MKKKGIVFLLMFSLLTSLCAVSITANAADSQQVPVITESGKTENNELYVLPDAPAVVHEDFVITEKDIPASAEKGTAVQYPVTVTRSFTYNYYSYTGSVIDQATVSLTGLWWGYGTGNFTNVQVSFSGTNASLLSSTRSFSGNTASVSVYLGGLLVAQYTYTMNNGAIY